MKASKVHCIYCESKYSYSSFAHYRTKCPVDGFPGPGTGIPLEPKQVSIPVSTQIKVGGKTIEAQIVQLSVANEELVQLMDRLDTMKRDGAKVSFTCRYAEFGTENDQNIFSS